ncbi:unnamed protein product, partial [Iphiclides podalirius]
MWWYGKTVAVAVSLLWMTRCEALSTFGVSNTKPPAPATPRPPPDTPVQLSFERFKYSNAAKVNNHSAPSCIIDWILRWNFQTHFRSNKTRHNGP